MLQERFKKELITTIKLSLPIIIAQLGVVLMGVSDNIMVGRLIGKVALGAAGVANSIAFLISSLAVGGMSVVAPMVSKCFAENNKNGIRTLYGSTIWVTIIYSIILSIVGLLSVYFFNIFQQPAIINETSPPFLIIILIANLPLYFFISLKQFSDGLSNPKTAMYITAIGLVTNIIGNYFLISGFGNFAGWGLMGAAYATLITRIIMLILLIIVLRYKSEFRTYFRKINFSIDKGLIKEILARSVPGGAQFFFEIAAFSFAVIMMGWIGETALAAHQIAINIASTTYMMATGISFAGGIRVGEAWGRKSPRGIRVAGFAAYFLVFSFMLISMILILVFDRFLLSIYISDSEVINMAIPLLTIAAIFQLSDGIQVVGLGVLRGLADITIPTIITFVSYWVLALPLGYFLGFKFGFGPEGIWLGLLVGLTVSALMLYFRFKNLISLEKLKIRFFVK
jgi:MATE family multidrug resistance protein